LQWIPILGTFSIDCTIDYYTKQALSSKFKMLTDVISVEKLYRVLCIYFLYVNILLLFGWELNNGSKEVAIIMYAVLTHSDIVLEMLDEHIVINLVILIVKLAI
jgi:hypothetical protein